MELKRKIQRQEEKSQELGGMVGKGPEFSEKIDFSRIIKEKSLGLI